MDHATKRLFLIVLHGCIALSAIQPSFAFAQTFGSDFHTVTVQVSPITVMQLSPPGAVTLPISGADAVAGQDQMSASIEPTQLLWGTNSSLRKITVSTGLATPLFTLSIAAINPTVGTAISQFEVNTTAKDLLRDIGRSSGRCTLRYTGTALASQGTGTDLHLITFTIQAQ